MYSGGNTGQTRAATGWAPVTDDCVTRSSLSAFRYSASPSPRSSSQCARYLWPRFACADRSARSAAIFSGFRSRFSRSPSVLVDQCVATIAEFADWLPSVVVLVVFACWFVGIRVVRPVAMNKAKTLPRAQREASPTPSSSSFASLRSATSEKIKKMPLIRRKKKKKSNSLEVPEVSLPGSDSRTDVSDVEVLDVSTTPGGPSPAASPSQLRPNTENGLASSPKSPRSAKRTKDALKSIIKGGKNLITFKDKKESAPIMVEPVLDPRRSNRKEDEDPAMLYSSNENLRLSDGEGEQSEKPETPETPKTPDDDYDWSVKSTCIRVKRLSIAGQRESVYEDEFEADTSVSHDVNSMPPTPEVWEEDADGKSAFQLSPAPLAIPETVSDSSDQSSMTFNKKSPTTLKKEILQITKQRKASEHAVNGTLVRNRKISLQARASSDKNELLFKILVIGELGTGKTSIIKRYVHQFFSQHYRATIGVDFALKVLSWDNDTTIRLQLWDIAGQERFGNMTRVYYKEAVGAFIVFDVTRLGTFDAVVKWKQDLDSKVQLPDGGAIPCVLLANKCDQPKEGVVNNHSKMDEFCKENQFIAWYETSAKDNINIDEAAHTLVTKIIQNDQKRQQEKETANGTSSGTITVSPEHHEPDKKKSCAC